MFTAPTIATLLLLGGAHSGFEEHFRQGLLNLAGNRTGAAEFHLKEAARLKPGDPRPWFALSEVYSKSRDHAQRRAAAAKAVAAGEAMLANEDSAGLRNLLGKSYEAAGQSDKAILALQAAVRMSPYEEAYYADLARVLLEHQNFDTAITVLQAGRKTFDKSPQLELMLGVAFYGQRRFSDAVHAFLRTIELAPDVEQPYLFLARILEHAEARLAEVVAHFRRFAESNPASPNAHFVLGKALAVEGSDAALAEKSLRRSIAINQNHWEAHFELATLLERKRDFPAAAEEFRRSAALSPRSPAPHYRLARVYDRLGRTSDAAAERALHERLLAEEKASLEKHAAGVKRLELVIR
jgi:tetratricopeptide (TPR) repeat protein